MSEDEPDRLLDKRAPAGTVCPKCGSQSVIIDAVEEGTTYFACRACSVMWVECRAPESPPAAGGK